MKISATFSGPVPPDAVERNRKHAESLGLPKPSLPPLAVVGGGPSVWDHVGELRRWPGEIWGVGSAWPWLRDRGIEATFFCIDPQACVAGFPKGAQRAILASCTDPSVFAALKGADVSVFDLYERKGEANHGCTTATAAPVLAREIGHQQIHFFGCDSSFVERSHAYMNKELKSFMKVKVGGEIYGTDMAFLGQALCLAEVIRAAPEHFVCRSGGLLAALVADLDYEVVAMRRKAYEGLMTDDGRPFAEVYPPQPYKGDAHALASKET